MEVDSRGGRGRGKDIQRCYVSFTYVMIGTYTHTRAHTRTHGRFLVGRGEEEGRGGRKGVTQVDTQTHARVNRYDRVCQVIM